MITPAKKKNLYQEISSQIINMISKGVWKSGDKIPPEIELSKSFEVSRNAIRESIKALEFMGILTSKTGIGTFVSEQACVNINNLRLSSLIESESSLIELMETRLIVEPGLVYIATKKATEEDIKELEKIMQKTKKAAIEEKNYTFDMGLEFHKRILSIAGNKILSNLLDSIRENLLETRRKIFFKHLKVYVVAEELKEHEEILAHIKNKEAEKAKEAMYKHIEKSLSYVKKSMEEEGDQ